MRSLIQAYPPDQRSQTESDYPAPDQGTPVIPHQHQLKNGFRLAEGHDPVGGDECEANPDP